MPALVAEAEAQAHAPLDAPALVATASEPVAVPIAMEAEAHHALGAYLEKQGGSASLVSNWSVRIATRDKTPRENASGAPAAKHCDVYFYDEHNFKFRSKSHVAAHFGLIERRITAGSLGERGIDAKLWPGAAAQGWTVTVTADDHFAYRAPDGTRFGRRNGALGWEPSTACVPVLTQAPTLPTHVRKRKAPPEHAEASAAAPTSAPVCKPKQARKAAPAITFTDAIEHRAYASTSTTRKASAGELVRKLDHARAQWRTSEVPAVQAPSAVQAAGADLTSDYFGHAHSDAHSDPHSNVPTPTADFRVGAALTLPPPSMGSGTVDGMVAVRAALAVMKLEAYAGAFEEQGWDDLEFLAEKSQQQLLAVARSVAMKHGHAHKFADWLRKTVAQMGA